MHSSSTKVNGLLVFYHFFISRATTRYMTSFIGDHIVNNIITIYLDLEDCCFSDVNQKYSKKHQRKIKLLKHRVVYIHEYLFSNIHN